MEIDWRMKKGSRCSDDSVRGTAGPQFEFWGAEELKVSPYFKVFYALPCRLLVSFEDGGESLHSVAYFFSFYAAYAALRQKIEKNIRVLNSSLLEAIDFTSKISWDILTSSYAGETGVMFFSLIIVF